jgi:hypothetical protein
VHQILRIIKQHQFHIERIIEADEQLAVEVGALLTDLSDKLSGDPVDMALLSSIVDSPDRDLFIARLAFCTMKSYSLAKTSDCI